MSPNDPLSWHEIDVAGTKTTYAVGGEGTPVLFLHGWALGNRAYQRPVRRLIRRGCRVYAPALPGLGGTADLPPHARTISGLGWWASSFLRAVGVHESVLVVGHSLGGAVAIGLAHGHGDQVRYLVLLNAVGGGRWSGHVGDSEPLKDRPLWGWATHFAGEAVVAAGAPGALVMLGRDVVTNLLRNPGGLWRAASLARTANLNVELAALRRRRLPVLALTSTSDGVIPRAAFDALCAAIGTDGHVVAGRHSWLLTDPDSMPQVLANVVDVTVAEHRAKSHSTRVETLGALLAQTPMPPRSRQRLLDGASPLWLMSEDEQTLAGDLALCVPRLEPGEVRAVVRGLEDSRDLRLTVVRADRPGLLADTAAVLAGEGLSILGATAVTWRTLGLALHSVTVRPDEVFSIDRWDVIGARLRESDKTVPLPPALHPSASPRVTVHGAADDRTLVTVEADDQLGLLATICRWVAEEGASIESLGARTSAGRAYDSLVVRGTVAADTLLDHLGAGVRRGRSMASTG